MPAPPAPAMLVRIEVNDGKLSMGARRRGDVTVYHHEPKNGPPTPGRPNEVAWTATGLTGGQTIEIKAKPSSQNMRCMAKDVYDPLTASGNIVYSQPTLRGPAAGVSETWSYTVTLLDAQKNELNSIDPDIIIKFDP